jgi:NADH dehydrogenase
VYRLVDLVRFAGKMAGISRFVIPLPNWVGKLQAFFTEKMPGPTLMSRDNVDSMKVDNILPNDKNPIRDVFDLELQSLESLLR